MTSAGFAVKVAVTVVFAVMLNAQTVLVLPAQAPAQLVKDEFALGTAVRVMEVLVLNEVPDGVC
jgi:hypothetical protein